MANLDQGLLEIETLGRFTVNRGEIVVSEKARRSRVIWELFKYMLTNRGSRLQADSVLETLWPDKEYEDVQAAFKAQVHRLKRMLAEDGLDNKHYFQIVFTQGCYRMDLGGQCRLDTDLLKELFNKAKAVPSNNIEEAIAAYKPLLTLYRGDYLPEINSPWILSARSNYRRYYLRSIFNLSTLYGSVQLFSEAVNLYEEALQLVPFEEELHIGYMQALMDAGKKREARAHYEDITMRDYLEQGGKPSVKMKDIYQQITHKSEMVELDLSNVQEMMVDRNRTEEAFICQPDYFRFLYSLEKRRLERKGRSIFLGLLTITRRNYRLLSPAMQEAAVTVLKRIIPRNIRKGDVYTQWNETQFLLLLPDLTRKTGGRVLKRIKDQFQEESGFDDLVLRYKIQPLL